MVRIVLWGRRILSSTEINIHYIYYALGLCSPSLFDQGHRPLKERRLVLCLSPLVPSVIPSPKALPCLPFICLGSALYDEPRGNHSFLCVPVDFVLAILDHCVHSVNSITMSTSSQVPLLSDTGLGYCVVVYQKG